MWTLCSSFVPYASNLYYKLTGQHKDLHKYCENNNKYAQPTKFLHGASFFTILLYKMSKGLLNSSGAFDVTRS